MIRVRGIPLYWGIETEAVDKRFLVYSILHESLPPFRHSTFGIRIRLTPWHYLHVGTYLYDKNLRLYGLQVGVGEISTWGFHDQESEEGAGPVAAEQVRPVGGEGTDRLHRIADAEDSGTVSGIVTTDPG